MKTSWLIHGLILLVIVAIGIGPWIPVAIAGGIAEANGCAVHEGGPEPCIVDGVDKGEELYQMGMYGWIGLATCPLALGLLFVYAVVLVIIRVTRNRKQAAAS